MRTWTGRLDPMFGKYATNLGDRIATDILASIPGDTTSTRGQGGLGPAARRAAEAVRDVVGFTGTIGEYSIPERRGYNKLSKHALGKVIDVMTYSHASRGRSIANYFLASPTAGLRRSAAVRLVSGGVRSGDSRRLGHEPFVAAPRGGVAASGTVRAGTEPGADSEREQDGSAQPDADHC